MRAAVLMLRQLSGVALFFSVLPGMAFAAEPYPQKFDLICHGWGRVVFEPFPPTRGSGKKTWREDVHYIIDLSSMVYCVDAYCSGGGRQKILSREGDRIFFEDELGLHESVDLRSRQYVHQLELDQGGLQASRIKCRIARFSGFRW